MKRNAALALSLLTFLGSAVFAHINSTHPDFSMGGYSGAPGDENCAVCHTGGLNVSGRGSVALTWAGDTWRAGTPVRITITINDPSARRWGYQLTARLVSNTSSTGGTFSAPDSNSVPIASGQYIGHTAAGTRPGQAGPVTFEVDWNPPAAGSGPVRFYISSNAANNNSSNGPGDFVYTSTRDLAELTATTPNPAITSAIQTFNYRDTASPGTWVEIYGTNFQPTADLTTWDGKFSGPNAPTSLNGYSVTIGGRGAAMWVAAGGQINAQVPDGIGTGPQPIVISGPNNAQSQPFNINIQPTSPALLAPAGFKVNDVQHIVANFTDLTTYVGPPGLVAGATFRQARPGETVILYAVGLGATTPNVPTGQVPSTIADIAAPFSLTIGAVPVQTARAFLYAPYIGLYRIDVVVPPGVAPGNQVVEMTVGGVATNQSAVLTIGSN